MITLSTSWRGKARRFKSLSLPGRSYQQRPPREARLEPDQVTGCSVSTASVDAGKQPDEGVGGIGSAGAGGAGGGGPGSVGGLGFGIVAMRSTPRCVKQPHVQTGG